jgi:methylenetetrahydrofolate--tRNA-(uracil-5-)-methyltransferase
MTHNSEIIVIGAGLAGSEAAWQIAKKGLPVRLLEMKPLRFSPAHSSPDFGELVCSNSLRSDQVTSGPGLLKAELRLLDSLIMAAADATSVPAGKALAVDRGLFSEYITQRIRNHPLISVDVREITDLGDFGDSPVIVATGPLTSDALAGAISASLGAEGLSFYDAIAPIVFADSLDMTKLFSASRYDTGEGDYLNSPLDEPLYRAFVKEIGAAIKVEPYPFEKIPHFEGCLPIEELARRGEETLAFGPMKPVGLTDPKTGRQPYAVVQLRAENREGTLYNLVGFQTKMTFPEQERIFRMLPGLENAGFARLGSVHRNTYLNSPELLDEYSRAKSASHIFFAGQITGVEGYIESTASGLAVGLYAAGLAKGLAPTLPSAETAVGALMKHTRTKPVKKYEPMNVNFGLFEPLEARVHKRNKKEALAERALIKIAEWKKEVERMFDSR